uniref:C-type lectin domain-containing protein n=1 Tax=Peromyscus maniculatus bairdii TaxID=230844 RepID=A0A8C8TLJ3_PERMB
MMPPKTLCSMSWILLSYLIILSWVQGEESQMKAPFPCISCPQGSHAYGSYCSSLILIAWIWTNAEGCLPIGNGRKWSSSDVLTYYNWKRNPSIAADLGYCAALSQAAGYQKWKDCNCETQPRYVCKFKG